MDSLIIIVTGALVAICCSLLGSFLVLRKMAMVSDAISHAVLPGIVIAYMIMGADQTIWMLIGAGLVGMITTFLIEFFHKKGKLQTDASIGVTFTWLFSLGVILISFYAGDAHIDQDCVLYGEIAYVPLDLIITDSGQIIGPRALIVLSIVLIVVLAFLVIGYKELYAHLMEILSTFLYLSNRDRFFNKNYFVVLLKDKPLFLFLESFLRVLCATLCTLPKIGSHFMQTSVVFVGPISPSILLIKLKKNV